MAEEDLHPAQLGDHLERQFGRNWVTKSASTLFDDVIDDGVGGAVDALLELADGAAREALVDQPAVAGVDGGVHVQHDEGLLGNLILSKLPEQGALRVRPEQLVVTVDRDAFLRTRDGPEAGTAGLVLPVHGVVAPQVGQVRVGDPVHVGPGVREIDGVTSATVLMGWTTPLWNRTCCPIPRIVRPDRGCQRTSGQGPSGPGQWRGRQVPLGAQSGWSAGVSGMMATDFVGSSGSRITRTRWSASGGSPGTAAMMTTSSTGAAKTE